MYYGLSRRRDFRLPAAILAAFVLIPSVAIFSLHWNPASPAGSQTASAEPASSSLQQKAAPARAQWLRESLKPVANPCFSGSAPQDPFGAAWLYDDGSFYDNSPFAAAYAAGVTEGRMEKSVGGDGVPVLGPIFRSPGSARMSDREILHLLRTGVAGSFNKFYANVFATANETDREMAAADAAGENPFRKTAEPAQSPAAQPAKQAAAEETKTEPAKDQQTQPTQAQQSEPAAPNTAAPAAAPVTTVRPDLLLRVTEGGLKSMAASYPRQGTFETSDLGVADFDLLPFSDPADSAMAIAVADFNNDGAPDVAVDVVNQGMLRFWYGNGDGTYSETMRVRVGTAPLSIAAGDFNHDGFTDIALSNVGVGLVTVLFANPGEAFSFKSFWTDTYRDYITASDTTGTGIPDIVGVLFGNQASVLVDFTQQPDGRLSGRTVDVRNPFATQISTADGRSAQLSAVAFNSSLSVNLGDRQGRLRNVINVAAGVNVYVAIGDLDSDGRLVVGVATRR
jgi:hypothetical protein